MYVSEWDHTQESSLLYLCLCPWPGRNPQNRLQAPSPSPPSPSHFLLFHLPPTLSFLGDPLQTNLRKKIKPSKGNTEFSTTPSHHAVPQPGQRFPPPTFSQSQGTHSYLVEQSCSATTCTCSCIRPPFDMRDFSSSACSGWTLPLCHSTKGKDH